MKGWDYMDREYNFEREDCCGECYWYWNDYNGKSCHCEESVHKYAENTQPYDVGGFFKTRIGGENE